MAWRWGNCSGRLFLGRKDSNQMMSPTCTQHTQMCACRCQPKCGRENKRRPATWPWAIWMHVGGTVTIIVQHQHWHSGPTVAAINSLERVTGTGSVPLHSEPGKFSWLCSLDACRQLSSRARQNLVMECKRRFHGASPLPITLATEQNGHGKFAVQRGVCINAPCEGWTVGCNVSTLAVNKRARTAHAKQQDCMRMVCALF